MIKLVSPTIEHEKYVMDYRKSLLELKEVIHGASDLSKFDDYKLWLNQLKLESSIETVPKGRVSATTYLVFNESDELIGTVNLRHYLNDAIKDIGHIGYGVAPKMRRKGYATKILNLALDEARKLNLDEIIISCEKSNVGSRKTIIKNGGKLIREVNNSCEGIKTGISCDDSVVEVYVIRL